MGLLVDENDHSYKKLSSQRGKAIYLAGRHDISSVGGERLPSEERDYEAEYRCGEGDNVFNSEDRPRHNCGIEITQKSYCDLLGSR